MEGSRWRGLDGGGVRGLCSLLVLKDLMREIQTIQTQGSSSDNSTLPLPCKFFDLAGGTSTGGFIAIMLFRLRMDIDQAICEYRKITPQIFRSSPLKYFGGDVFKAFTGRPWYKAENLVRGVARIMRDQKPEDETAENAILCPTTQPTDFGGKMFVCALRTADNGTVLFKDYPEPDGPTSKYQDCTISQAAQATSAAPFYFPAATINGEKFWDGGVGNNNPIDLVWNEKDALNREPSFETACVVNLGTGVSERKVKKSYIPLIGKAKGILKNVTKVEDKHLQFEKRMTKDPARYVRFNPTTADDDIGLADHKKMAKLEQYTRTFLEDSRVHRDVVEIAEILAQVSQDRTRDQYKRAKRTLETKGEILLDGTHFSSIVS